MFLFLVTVIPRHVMFGGFAGFYKILYSWRKKISSYWQPYCKKKKKCKWFPGISNGFVNARAVLDKPLARDWFPARNWPMRPRVDLSRELIGCASSQLHPAPSLVFCHAVDCLAYCIFFFLVTFFDSFSRQSNASRLCGSIPAWSFLHRDGTINSNTLL